MITTALTDAEVATIRAITDDLAQRYATVEDDEFQQESRVYAEELPRRVRREFNQFRTSDSDGLLLLSGLPVDDVKIGATPAHWQNKQVPSPTLEQDFAFYLIACLLGDPIGWATQQSGDIMHDVLPIKGHEHEQLGSSSDELLTWHTEDAFHPQRADYLSLMCLRNPDKVETTFADIGEVSLDADTRAILSEERFSIMPDDSHQEEGTTSTADGQIARLQQRSHQQIKRWREAPDPVAVLFGDPDSPYLRVDPYYMADLHGEEEQRALDTLSAAIDSAMSGVALQPGDICFIDNFHVVHGRKPFRARFDGTDRWLRRLNIVRDLRKSRGLRAGAKSRVIY
jgi:enduracididine beta-hydroxylase